MAYTEQARRLRRCVEIMDNGRRCPNWRMWGSPVCVSHHPERMHTGPRSWPPAWMTPQEKKIPPCRCRAYRFPHRWQGGDCTHPDPPEV